MLENAAQNDSVWWDGGQLEQSAAPTAWVLPGSYEYIGGLDGANDLVMSKSLLSAVIVSLFTDARAADDDPLPDERSEDRRGWWGDSTNTGMPEDSVGSKLWLLEREKNMVDVTKKAKAYVEEALMWMVNEGIASSVLGAAEAQPMKNTPGAYVLAFSATIAKPDGTTESFKFEQEWKAVN